MKWKEPNKAPKDGTCILGKFESYPYPTVASWNGVNKDWVVAELNVGMYEGEHNDTYFENEHYKEEDLIEWAEL
jgi:hypothetical protein